MLNKVFIILNLLFLFRILWLSDWHSGDQHLIPGFLWVIRFLVTQMQTSVTESDLNVFLIVEKV